MAQGLRYLFVFILSFKVHASDTFTAELFEHEPLTLTLTESAAEIRSLGTAEQRVSCVESTIILRVKDPDNNSYPDKVAHIYRPYGKKAFSIDQATMIVVPTIKGITLVEKEMVKDFCGREITSIVLDDSLFPEDIELPDWGAHDRKYIEMIRTVRTIIDQVKLQNGPHAKVGLMGASLGGITAALITGVDSRIDALVTIAAGAGTPYMLTYSQSRKVKKLREQRMRHTKMKSLAEYEAQIALHNHIDPSAYGANVPAEKQLMFILKNDRAVPTTSQWFLWESFNKPQQVNRNYSHVLGILITLRREKERYLDFIESRLRPVQEASLTTEFFEKVVRVF